MCIRDSHRLDDAAEPERHFVTLPLLAAERLLRREVIRLQPVSYTHLTLPTSDLV